MRHLQTLEPQEGRGNGKAQICAMRIGAELGLQIPALHMPKARASSAGNRAGQGHMACPAARILARTAQAWEVAK